MRSGLKLVAITAASVFMSATPVLAAQREASVAKPAFDAEMAKLIEAALSSKHRNAEERARDVYRNPAATLAFFGLRSDMTVIEVSPGGGWWTDILAPVLRDKGKLQVAMSTNINGPARRGLGSTLTRFAETPEVFGKVEIINYAPSQGAKLGVDNSADMILVMRHMHGLIGNKIAPQALKSYYDALKPGGVLAIEQHRWPDGKAYPAKQASWGYENNGYITEADIIGLATAAGFKLAGRSEINANPKDTRDYVHGVWSLKPTLRGDDATKAQRAAIGESDRMTLRFVKPAA